MSEERTGGWGVWLIGLACLTPVLYVLSVGPASRFVPATGTGMAVARTFYFPLIWLHDNTPLKKPLEWYTRVWER